MPSQPVTNARALLDHVQWLADFAEAGGADPMRRYAAAAALTNAVMERDVLLRAADRRRLATLELAKKVRQADHDMDRAAYPKDERIDALCERFGKSPSRIYALLADSCESQETSVASSGK